MIQEIASESVNIWTIIAAVAPTTIATIASAFHLSTKVTRIETKIELREEEIRDLKKSTRKCETGVLHERPHKMCYETFEEKQPTVH